MSLNKQPAKHLFELRHAADTYSCALLFVVSTTQLVAWLVCESAATSALAAAFLLLPMAMLGGVAHNHAHIPIFRNSKLNRLLDFLLYFASGIFVSKFRLHHVYGHHVFWADPDRDPSRWVRKDGKVMGRLEYTLRYYFGFTYQSIKIGRSHPSVLRVYFNQQVVTILIWSVLLAVAPVNALLLYFVPMRVSWFLFNLTTYDHHLNLESDDPYAAAHTQTHWLPNFISFNNGYHMAHHVKQSVHWADLPAYHSSIAHRAPANVDPATWPNRVWR